MVDAVFQHFMSKLIFNFNTSYPILKFGFSSSLLNIIIATNEKSLSNSLFKNLLMYNNLSKIILIFVFPTDFGNVFEYVLKLGFINALAMEYTYFENTSIYYYYDIIRIRSLEPRIRLMKAFYNKTNSSLFKNKLNNWSLSPIHVLLANEFPRTQLYNKDEAFGYLRKILHTFYESINVSLKLSPSLNSGARERSTGILYRLEQLHFVTDLEHLTNNQSDPHEIQHMSTVMELCLG